MSVTIRRDLLVELITAHYNTQGKSQRMNSPRARGTARLAVFSIAIGLVAVVFYAQPSLAAIGGSQLTCGTVSLTDATGEYTGIPGYRYPYSLSVSAPIPADEYIRHQDEPAAWLPVAYFWDGAQWTASTGYYSFGHTATPSYGWRPLMQQFDVPADSLYAVVVNWVYFYDSERWDYGYALTDTISGQSYCDFRPIESRGV